VLVVIDNWAKSKTQEFRSKGVISRFGWTEEGVKKLCEAAGLALTAFDLLPPSEKGDNDMFIATAVMKTETGS
jgi:hypothetical protein